jgi:hypothetical protein
MCFMCFVYTYINIYMCVCADILGIHYICTYMLICSLSFSLSPPTTPPNPRTQVLFVLTMKRQIKHMLDHGYLPFK